MTEEVKQNEEDTAPEATPVELEARQHGWKPKEDFDADERNAGKMWRTAENFMDRKSLFDKIEQVKEENKVLKRGIQSLSQHHQNVEKTAYQRALAELKQQREAALEDDDFIKAERIRDRMDEVKEQIKNVQPPVNVETPPQLVEWKARNDWYQKDEDLTLWADGLGQKLLAQGMSPDRILEEVEKKVQPKLAPTRNPNKDTAPEVVASGKRASVSSTGFRLTEQEEKMMNNMIKAGAPITREQYIAELKAQRGN